jgi:two-component system sensor histidine kinase/response regulator
VNKRTRELEEANAELMVLDDAKTEFLKLISHEIRTPLNGIIGFLGVLKERLETSELNTYLDILNESAARLEKFAISALHITNLKLRKDLIRKDVIQVNKLVRKIVDKYDDKMTGKDITLSFNESDTGLINGDSELIAYCIENILDNAINHSDSGAKIRISTETKGDEAVLVVSDEGPGFSDKALKELYKLFCPGEKHCDSNKGLSMALVKMIMDAHSGKIDAGNKCRHRGQG